MSEAVELLRSSYLFADLDEVMLAQVASRLEYRDYDPQSWIFKQGDPGDALFLLAQGQVEIHKSLEEQHLPLSELEAPAAFGEASLLNEEPRTTSAKCRSKTRCALLRCADFQALLLELPAFALALTRNMVGRFVSLKEQAPAQPAPPLRPSGSPVSPGRRLEHPPRPLRPALPEGWLALADPLNSRILKLDQALEPVWALDTTLIQVFRPLQVRWATAGTFVLLDGESGHVSCWNSRARLEWSLQGLDHNWIRMELMADIEGLALLLLDSNGVLSLRRSDGSHLWSSQTDADLGQILDFRLCPDGQLWLLQEYGQLVRYDFGAGIQQHSIMFGSPSVLALAENGALAAYDPYARNLFVQTRHLEESVELPLLESRYRMTRPMELMWTGENTLCLYDAYRLLELDVRGNWLRKSLLQFLPDQLDQAPPESFSARARRELALQAGNRLQLNELLQRVAIFARAPEALLSALSRQLRTLVYNRGDLIVRQGEPGSELFIIKQGQCQVLDDKQRDVVATMGPGNLFGEVSLMLGLPRTASIRAAGYCELLCLRQTDLDELLPAWPELRQRLLQLAQERQTQQALRTEESREGIARRIRLLETAPPPESEAEEVQELPDLALWVRHQDQGQLALIDRQGEVLRLLDQEIGLMQPVAMHMGQAGLWVLDAGLAELHLLDPETLRLRKIFAQWPHAGGELTLDQPWDLVAAEDGSLWLLNAAKGQLLHLDADGSLLQVLNIGKFPTSLQLLPNGHFLISDLRQHTVTEISPAGFEIWRYGTPRRFGREENLLFAPEYARRLENGHVLIADTGNSRVLEVALDGRIVWSLNASAGLQLQRPSRCERIGQHTLVEHSRRRRWLEVDMQQQVKWEWELPEEGIKV